MKILLDECVTRKLKIFLTEYEAFTVSEMSWNGLKNGNLMKVAIDNSFDILLTIDKNIAFQQNLNKYDIIIVVLDVEKSKIEFLKELLPSFKMQINNFRKGKAYQIKTQAIL